LASGSSDSSASEFRSPWEKARPLEGRTALVTGAGRGIGRGVAEELAACGAYVIAADLDIAQAQDTVVGLEGSGEAVRVDVSDPGSVQRLFRDLKSSGKVADVLANVAGVLSLAPVTELSVEEWDRVMAVNARGVFLMSQGSLPAMIDAGGGAIVNVSSISGKIGEPTLAHYCASKFAVLGFTQSLAKEVAEFGIRVNAVCPGVVLTPMIDQVAGAWGQTPHQIAADLQLIKKPQHPREIGAAVVFLATMPSVTGQAVNIDGGTVFH
jgi:meso-butanediol dehydrogenase / (S,S)-butanediol dehydrogenase / diacetyl reductase